MELLTSHRSKYILDAGLEVLHEQSNEWLNEIAFWKDEIAFFYSLIVRKTLKSVPISAKDIIIKIETELTAISGGELDQLQQAVEQHEHHLSNLLNSLSVNEEIYRKKHKQLTLEFESFEKRLKMLKKEVFNLIKLINRNKVD